MKSSREFASARLMLFSPILAETPDGFCVTLMREFRGLLFLEAVEIPTAG